MSAARVVRDMPEADYHGGPELSHSGAIRLLESAAAYREWKRHGMTPSDSMRMGTAVHAEVLQPGRAADLYCVAPDVNRRTKAGKDELAEFTAAAPKGAAVITAAQHAHVRGMADALRKDQHAAPLLESLTDRELSIFWQHRGVSVRARLDGIGPADVVDLKTTRDANPRWFVRSAVKYGYHVQAAWYSRAAEAAGMGRQGYKLIVVESKPPYQVAVFDVGRGMMRSGAAQMDAACSRFAECQMSDESPGFGDRVHLLEFDEWTLDRETKWAEHNGYTEEDPF